jgi:hypothetical protein
LRYLLGAGEACVARAHHRKFARFTVSVHRDLSLGLPVGRSASVCAAKQGQYGERD